MKYVATFIAIQLVSLVLSVIGLPVCAALAYTDSYSYDIHADTYHWPKWAWLWDNEEDGVCPHWYILAHPTWTISRVAFYWTALRNPCNNLRFVRGVSRPGWPLWYKTWTMLGRQFYAKAGWEAKTGYPSLSAGSGRGY